MLKYIKSRIKKNIELKEYFFDLLRYHRHANFGFNSTKTQATQLSMISKYYHIIEKGLTMPETRFGFGTEVLIRIIKYCNDYLDNSYDEKKLEFQHALNVLSEYREFHFMNDFVIDSNIDNSILELFKRVDVRESTSKQITTTKEEFFKYSNSSFDLFSKSRHSIRNYLDKDIDLDILIKCISIAQNSPSACNRQANNVIIVSSKDIIKNVLSLQSGNRGFGHLSNKLLVITSDISAFARSHEKFGPHFNSGLFSMSLIYALHFHKIGNCSLNWSTSYSKDKELRKLLAIPDNEYITLIISCGYLPDNVKYASSPRKVISDIYRII